MEQQDLASTDSVPALFPLLSDPSCLDTLRQLRDRPNAVTSIHDLADDLPAGSYDWPGDPNLRLHHVILPKLAEAGLVEYDTETRTVQYWAHGPLEQ